MGIGVEFLRRVSLRRLFGEHAFLSLAKWGASRGAAQAVLKLSATRVALGAATTGVTGLTVHQQLKEPRIGRQGPLGSDVLLDGVEVEWINAAAKPVWDHLNAGLRRVIIEELEPALQKRVPVVGRYMCFKKLTLGETAPRLGPVTVTRSRQGSDGVELSIGVEFTGDLAIEFSAGVATVEVTDVVIRGSILVLLRPLVDAINPCGGVCIVCPDRPSVDLKIRASRELLPNLFDLVRETVDDVIASIIVAPNGIAVSIPTFGAGTDTDWVSLRYPVPSGILRVIVEQVAGTQEAPVASPYVQVHVGAATWRTPTARRRSSDAEAVRWEADNVQDFAVYTDRQLVEVRVFREGTLSLDGLLGCARVPLSSVLGRSLELPLVLPDGNASGRQLTLRGEWFAVEDAPPSMPLQPSTPSQGSLKNKFLKSSTHRTATAGPGNASVLLSVLVDEVSGLPADASRSYTLRVSAGGWTEDTSTGEAPEAAADSIGDDRALVMLARKLSPLLTLADLADTLGISVQHAREFAEQSHSHGENFAQQARFEKEWCARARAQARAIAASSNPQFKRLFHLPIPAEDCALALELVCRGEDAPGDGRIVARLDCNLSAVATASQGWLRGPFPLTLPDGGECTLHGSLRLRGMRRQESPESDEHA